MSAVTPASVLRLAESVPETPPRISVTPELERRFWAKVDKSRDGCWEWQAYKSKRGYGTFRAGSKMVKAHRFAYTATYGDIPDGLLIDHECHNRGCVNPSHLRPATLSQNAENKDLHKADTKSGVRGVCWSPKLRRWLAYASKNRRRYHVGVFDTIEEAAEAARVKRLELFTYNASDRKGHEMTTEPTTPAPAQPFDYMEPLPPMPDYRARSWEPAARHYRDIEPEERDRIA